jgi:hypothetical protein
VTAVGQGALFGLINVAIRENAKTNVRANEIYLAARVDYDANVKEGGMKASEFGKVYEGLLADDRIRGSRVSVRGHADLTDLKWKPKLQG